ncbi:CobW/HypB/UreG, nucleotide-binding domain-containing protein [Gorgonomyces haynaldii]|nr:CobW/HypB/UreG, nucleotide-binding domain-containing protein [Gorgonomyces haynaldii]
MDSFDIPELIPDAEPELQELQTMRIKDSVPVTLITGFLGSGKSTLVMQLLSSPKLDKRIAVILNEFGESTGIDKSLRMDNGKLTEEWLELANGCLCCSVKDSGVKAIEQLIEKNTQIDYVLLETTGLADPGPIASLFWLDEALQSKIHLDGIVTIVDSKYIQEYLNQVKPEGEINEATKQIAMADRIVLNKIDLVSESEQQQILFDLKSINASAEIMPAVRSNVPLNFVLNLHAFDNKQQDPFKDLNQAHIHSIDRDVKTVTFTLKSPLDRKRTETWLQQLLWEKNLLGYGIQEFVILRFKAVMDFGTPTKHIVQSVHEMYDVHQGQTWDEEKINKLVFIGKLLDLEKIKASFASHCLQ